MNTSFYSEEELETVGFKKFGKSVLLSKKASVYSPELIEIGNNVRIDDFCILSGKIKLGNFIHIAAHSVIFGGEAGVEMEDFSGLSSRVSVYAISDDYSGNSLTNPMVPNKYRILDSKKVLLKKHVLIGSGSVILPGVIINEGTVVGALSLVNKSLDPWKLYLGNPIRCIKNRSYKLLELEKEFRGEINE